MHARVHARLRHVGDNPSSRPAGAYIPGLSVPSTVDPDPGDIDPSFSGPIVACLIWVITADTARASSTTLSG